MLDIGSESVRVFRGAEGQKRVRERVNETCYVNGECVDLLCVWMGFGNAGSSDPLAVIMGGHQTCCLHLNTKFLLEQRFCRLRIAGRGESESEQSVSFLKKS